MKRHVVAVISISALALLPGCGEKIRPGTAEVARTAVKDVEVEKIEPVEAAEYIEAPGTVKAKTVSTLSSKVMGAVTSIRVREGESVRAGELLLTIDDSGVLDKVRQAEAAYAGAQKGLEAAKANLDMANLTYERFRKLHEGKAISQQEFDQIETQRRAAEAQWGQAEEGVKQARAGLGEARTFLDYTRVKAPFAGVVTARMTDTGSMASPGMPLFTIEDTSGFVLEVNVSERYSGLIRRGAIVEVAVDTVPGVIKGRVTEAVPSVDPQSRTFLVKVSLKGSGLKTGLYARVKAPVGTRTALLVPEASIVSRGGLRGVYAVDDKGVITYRLVREGSAFDHSVEILSGLAAGDRIIVKGVDRAVDGGVVKGGA